MNPIQHPQTNKNNVTASGGQILFDKKDTTSAYHLLAGEVLILRNGQMVDLVQTGELLDASIWNGVTAVAWTNCILQPISTQPQKTFHYANPSSIASHLHRSASAAN